MQILANAVVVYKKRLMISDQFVCQAEDKHTTQGTTDTKNIMTEHHLIFKTSLYGINLKCILLLQEY